MRITVSDCVMKTLRQNVLRQNIQRQHFLKQSVLGTKYIGTKRPHGQIFSGQNVPETKHFRDKIYFATKLPETKSPFVIFSMYVHINIVQSC
jgi:hypothetical protein